MSSNKGKKLPEHQEGRDEVVYDDEGQANQVGGHIMAAWEHQEGRDEVVYSCMMTRGRPERWGEQIPLWRFGLWHIDTLPAFS